MAHQKIQVRGYTANLFSCRLLPCLPPLTCRGAMAHATNYKADPAHHGVGFSFIIWPVAICVAVSGLTQSTAPTQPNAALWGKYGPRHCTRATQARSQGQARQVTECTDSSPDRRARLAGALPHRPCLPLSAHRAFLARQMICRPEFFP